MSTGKLLAFEGPDGSGKTTMSKWFTQFLNDDGYKAVRMSFPDRSTPVGKIINSFLTGEIKLDPFAAQQLFTVNRYEKLEEMKKYLADGVHVILDRYNGSALAYGEATGVSLDDLKVLNQYLPKADGVFYLRVQASTSLERKRNQGALEIYENTETQERVLKNFDKLNATEPSWYVIDASSSMGFVQRKIIQLSSTILPE
jgi:dTMP kinase